MSSYTLHTYRNINELRKIQQENEVVPFIFVETKGLLEDDSSIFIDISALIYLLRVNKNDRFAAYINLRDMTDETTIILEESLADDALSFLPYLFSDCESFFGLEDRNEESSGHISLPIYTRQPIYTYNNTGDLKAVSEYAKLIRFQLQLFRAHLVICVRS